MTNPIRRLRLENFKCFREQELEVGDLTLLAGINGTGKSTVVQTLLWPGLLGCFAVKVRARPEFTAGHEPRHD
jgi:predicted ATPase